jgi:NADPH2:quinone reductase
MVGLAGGAFAERAVADVDLVSRVPDGMSFDEAAAVPVTYTTGYAALVYRAGLTAGETVLITAAAGGVGTASIQIARALGARVIAATRGADKLALVRALGADVVVDHAGEGWEQSVVDATRGRGVDVVIESVGGDVFDAAMRALAFEGRLVVVGFASGAVPEIKANRLLLRNVTVAGVYAGLYRDKHPARFQAAKRAVLAWCERGEIRPHVGAVYSLERTGEALAALAAGRTLGKQIVRP